MLSSPRRLLSAALALVLGIGFVAATLILGICPWIVTDLIGPSVAHLIENYNASLPAVAAVAGH